VISPDDVMNGVRPTSQVAIYDDDHYYMGSVLAELLRSYGCEVIFVTPAPDVAHWTHNTLEQGRIQAALIERGVRLETGQLLDHAEPGRVVTRCVYTGRLRALEAATLLLVTARDPEDSLARALAVEDGQPAGFRLHVIGDALAPGTIAAAVYGGHRAARHFEDPDMGSGFLRPRIELQSGTVVADASHGATLGVHSGRAPL
jgi:dimethylamine/trimethylamine dehydrogenase